MGWALVVAGVCWAVPRFRAVAAGLRGALVAIGAITAVCLVAASVAGGATAAGGVLLVLPQMVSGVLLLGLGVPWTATLPCGAVPLSPGGPLAWVPVVVLLGCAVVVAARTTRPGDPLRRAAGLAVRLGSVAGAALAVMALLSRASVELGVTAFGFSVPVLDAHLGANPLLALGAGLAAGAPAGFAGSLLVDGLRSRFSVSSRTWKR
jgi:hypothetical protein